MKFAVVETGGKQYEVSVGITLLVEKLPGEHKKGDEVTFDKVLLVDDGKDTTIGTPYIEGAAVAATFVSAGRHAKVDVIKYKQKSRYFKKRGHKQPYSKIIITTLP
ncbi:MAG: large subunit ribosomal protein L21 [Parcubacteria group bacterium Gr01-1014_48]|nr:MAG: large subunit ribosomal protein L21 [Parcubacteria group bacterium Greene0416_14]TSC74218.1 MAG: large subunit ribosomal protein L21 [Parcubacteria group bacterium Gr01-1014_48]TSD01722.1 MAG: large subunit ribosomal protein L21 [Parcubacteria group bacterium Greene1014_15]TSD07792.1 MAG: large subunit ribosomal protein L21 [Parcubacteria group bacterium Greene0714_4]